MRALLDRFARFFRRHPILREAFLWSLPALALGLCIRAALLSYSPYAYWGKDSESYFNFAFDLRHLGTVGFDAKRRYLYPLFLLPVSLLPGPTLQWIAWLQHLIGLSAILPLAYAIRRALPAWRITLVPATAFYAAIPILVWTEHEAIAETLFVSAIPWAMAGWIASVSQTEKRRAGRLWWIFLAAFAAVVLTKPSARFFWPGLVAALVLSRSWRFLGPRHWAALAALFLAGMTVGKESQGARLLYTTAFPLTRLDTPLHAEYKAEIRDLVEPLRRHAGAYYLLCDEDFLKSPVEDPNRPTWAALAGEKERLSALYRDLALEGIRSRPDLFLSFSLQRVLASANPKEFGPVRFDPGYFPERFAARYEDAIRDKPDLLRNLFAIPAAEPVPPYAELAARINPQPDSPATTWIRRYVEAFDRLFLFLRDPEADRPEERVFTGFRLTPLGWWLVAGALASLFGPFARTVGPWTLLAASYLFGVYLVGSVGVRYFMPAWPAIALLLAMPAEAVFACFRAASGKWANGAPHRTASPGEGV